MRSAYGHAGSAAARRAAARYERWSENRALRHRLRDCRSACADSPDGQSAFRGETDGPCDIRRCRNPARIRCARGLLHPGAPRNARGSYGRLEIRVVLCASDWQPFLRTSWHKRVGTSEVLSRTHVDAHSASLICGHYWRLFPSDGLLGNNPIFPPNSPFLGTSILGDLCLRRVAERLSHVCAWRGFVHCFPK